MRFFRLFSRKSKTGKSSSPSLRLRVFVFAGSLVVLSLAGSTLSLYRISQVNQTLVDINRVAVPLGRLVVQLKSDADLLRREMDRRLGFARWKDPHWRPQPIPKWIDEVIFGEIAEIKRLAAQPGDWANESSKERWKIWSERVQKGYKKIRLRSTSLYQAIQAADETRAAGLYPGWLSSLENWLRLLRQGALQADRTVRNSFSFADDQVSGLKTGLQVIVIAILFFSLLMLWLGERALRPLREITALARQISQRGLRKEDKGQVPHLSLSRNDEVSQLSREFKSMATTLLEREKTVEFQKKRLEEQNRLLRDMGSLNENILNSIDSILIVTDLKLQITQLNPVACQFLEKSAAELIGRPILSLRQLEPFLKPFKKELNQNIGDGFRLQQVQVASRTFGGHVAPLKLETGEISGIVLVLEDLTEQIEIENRLNAAEHLATVGRMSAQVAHEVRNPLHAIGLEAEMALEQASENKDPDLLQSVKSILAGVDRLESITENYLKLSRPRARSEQRKMNLLKVFEEVVSVFAPQFENKKVVLDWKAQPTLDYEMMGNPETLKQAISNLIANSLQALEGYQPKKNFTPKIAFSFGNTEKGGLWLRITDNGPGIESHVLERLFTPFLTTKAQGTGLGLSYVRIIVEEHGGKIQHVPTNEGACFEIVLPLAISLEQEKRTSSFKGEARL